MCVVCGVCRVFTAQYFFTSFYNRDDCFSLLESLWRAMRGDDILQESHPTSLAQMEGRTGAYAASEFGYASAQPFF